MGIAVLRDLLQIDAQESLDRTSLLVLVDVSALVGHKLGGPVASANVDAVAKGQTHDARPHQPRTYGGLDKHRVFWHRQTVDHLQSDQFGSIYTHLAG